MTKYEFAKQIKQEVVAAKRQELLKLTHNSALKVLEEELTKWWAWFFKYESYDDYDGYYQWPELVSTFRRMSFDITDIRQVAILVWNQWVTETKSGYSIIDLN